MILIGERINGMFTDVKQAIADKNKKVIQDLAQRQTQAGATYLDVNVGTAAADQEGTIQWLVETLLNSAPLNKKTDEEILYKYMEMAEKAGPKANLIALAMDKNGVPQDTDTRVAIAAEILQKALERGFETQRLFIDPIVLPVKVPNAQTQPAIILAAMDQIRLLADPPPHMTVGLSNLSQGAAERSLINRVFLAMAMSHGLDSAIADVFDENLMNAVATCDMLMNRQIYSDSFLKVYATANKK
ncbi:MAG: dihydropteroate synthase [Planctomycetota bacterium]|nr:dihydropteroate synthase [Planctomycetota bacterium]